MKFSLIATLFVAGVSFAAPIDNTDSKALARSVIDGTDVGASIDVRDSLESRKLNRGTPALSAALNDIYAPPYTAEQYSLEGFVQYTHGRLRDKFPGANIFIFHRFKPDSRFEWGVSDPNAEEAEVQKVVGFATEYYQVVVFRSAGVLRKSGDGGFINWIFSGKFTREGDNVNFQAP
ncbi:hypothetical protein A1Q2_08502 [Trichosporon asahii var. asahii CBS 8904]|uniref:Uncharacterized protein n=1 Tax=Trichosporon asahii var. asahii (strain CBS 8904) TaxID=1220162 RepID=K1V958_TRIAC|nr:hypothetical protein A1Q2_08502 [Trichosporon asahii var. asahii CBS 8904]